MGEHIGQIYIYINNVSSSYLLFFVVQVLLRSMSKLSKDRFVSTLRWFYVMLPNVSFQMDSIIDAVQEMKRQQTAVWERINSIT